MRLREPDAIRRVRDVLDRAEYGRAGIEEVLGEAPPPTYQLDRRELPRLRRRCAAGSPRETLLRLFLLGDPVEEHRARQAVAPLSVPDWVDLGLLTPAGGAVVSPFRIIPAEELLLAQEPLGETADVAKVMPVSGSTIALIQPLIRRPARAALDVGTGCGVLALLAAARSDQVIGTDCNPRAVNLAAFNAALNRLPNARFLPGDLFEPVRGQTFDLVLANPPYVISPEKRILFRDSGLPGDEISARVVQAAAGVLRPGGFAQVLINWAQVRGQDWRDRLAGWLEGSGCAAWLLRFQTVTPDRYATTWLPHEDDPRAHQRRFDEWLAYYDREGIEAIGSGLINLRRGTTEPAWFAYDDTPPGTGPCGESVVLAFALRDFLVRHPDDRSLLACRYRLNPALRGEQRLCPGPSGWQAAGGRLSLGAGLAFAMQVDAVGLELFNHLRPDRPLTEILTGQASRLGRELDQLSAALAPVFRRLIEMGVFAARGGQRPAPGLTRRPARRAAFTARVTPSS